MILSRWTRRIPPLPGELLTSCLARNAYAHGTTPYRFFSLFWPGDPVWNRDFDRHPCALSHGGEVSGSGWLTEIADMMQVSVNSIETASLQGLREVLAGDRLRATGDTPFLLSAGVYHRTRRCHALQFCPECLAEGIPHYRRIWRLGFVMSCDIHGSRRLLDACPHCCAPVVPHRSMGFGMTDCHSCGRLLTAGRGQVRPMRFSDKSLTLQRALLALTKDEPGPSIGPWQDRAAFDGVRALIAVSSSQKVRAALRETLALHAMPLCEGRMRFEQARVDARIALLDTAAAWLSDWPHSFQIGARGAKLTQRSFARQCLPAALAAEVATLPDGIRRDRTWVSILDEPALRRMRRRNPAAYRMRRAKLILEEMARR